MWFGDDCREISGESTVPNITGRDRLINAKERASSSQRRAADGGEASVCCVSCWHNKSKVVGTIKARDTGEVKKNSRGKKRTCRKGEADVSISCIYNPLLAHFSSRRCKTPPVKTTPRNMCFRPKNSGALFLWMAWMSWKVERCTHLLTNPTASQSVKHLVDKINITNQYITRVFTYTAPTIFCESVWVQMCANIRFDLWFLCYLCMFHEPVAVLMRRRESVPEQ